MFSQAIIDQIAGLGVVPVIAIDNVAEAIPLADALSAGGLPLVEITFRTKAAAEVIKAITRHRPGMLVGAGTVLTQENLEEAKASGAVFAVAPGLNPQTVKMAQAARLPFIPGVATAGEIERGLELGCKLLKFFPAGALGGVQMLEALAAPYHHTGVRFLPTGGVNPSNLETYLRIPSVAAVGGTWLARKEDLINGRWDEVTNRCRKAVETVALARKPI